MSIGEAIWTFVIVFATGGYAGWLVRDDQCREKMRENKVYTEVEKLIADIRKG